MSKNIIKVLIIKYALTILLSCQSVAKPGNVSSLIQKADTSLPILLYTQRAIPIDSVQVGKIEKEGDWSIVKEAKNYIAFVMADRINHAKVTPAVQNTISIPSGKPWHFSLGGGTDVMMAAPSSLNFSSDLLSPDRKAIKLQMRGNILFKQSTYYSGNFEIGTSRGNIFFHNGTFAIHDSGDAFAIIVYNGKITFMNGSHRQELNHGDSAVLMVSMNKLRVMHNTACLAMNPCDRGYFNFDGMNAKQVMQQFQDWYGLKNVSFLAIDTIRPGILGGGHVAKDADLPEILDHLDERNTHFSIRNDTIFLRNKELHYK